MCGWNVLLWSSLKCELGKKTFILNKVLLLSSLSLPDKNTHQFLDFTFQVVYAVEFALAAAASSDAVFAASADVMNSIELLAAQTLLLQHLLEVISAQTHDLIHGERQRHLEENRTTLITSSTIKYDRSRLPSHGCRSVDTQNTIMSALSSTCSVTNKWMNALLKLSLRTSTDFDLNVGLMSHYQEWIASTALACSKDSKCYKVHQSLTNLKPPTHLPVFRLLIHLQHSRD